MRQDANATRVQCEDFLSGAAGASTTASAGGPTTFSFDVPRDLRRVLQLTLRGLKLLFVDEQKRGLSIKAMPVSMLLKTSSEKHHLLNLIDTPGHTNFADEVTAALRLADGALLVVDAVEGVCPTTDRLIRHLIQERLPIVLLINKLGACDDSSVRRQHIRRGSHHAGAQQLHHLPRPPTADSPDHLCVR